MDRRRRKRDETRRALRQHALRLFSERGYDDTTVAEIAKAAGVSHMTFFRNFPTKEDVVAATDEDFGLDGLDDLADGAASGGDPLLRIRDAFRAGLARACAADRETLLVRGRLLARIPALRARLWENVQVTQRRLERGLSREGMSTLGTRVLAAACLSTMITAVLTWADQDGRAELPDLIDEAFAALADGIRHSGDARQ